MSDHPEFPYILLTALACILSIYGLLGIYWIYRIRQLEERLESLEPPHEIEQNLASGRAVLIKEKKP